MVIGGAGEAVTVLDDLDLDFLVIDLSFPDAGDLLGAGGGC